MKHLTRFNNFEQINEEEGILGTMLLAGALLFNNVEKNPEKVGVQTEVVAENPKLQANFLQGATDIDKCSNVTLYKFGLPKSTKTYYTCTVGEFKSRIGGDTALVLADFKPIQSVNKALDYIKIGKDILINSGTEYFDLTNPNAVIIASGNGLLALSRAARAGGDSSNYSMLKVTFRSDRGSRSVDYDLSNKTDMEGSCNTLYYMFQTSITPKEKFHPTSIGQVTLPKLIGASDSLQVQYIASFMDNAVRKFIPKEIQNQVLEEVDFKKTDTTFIKEFLDECKKTGKVDYRAFEQKILTPYKNLFMENFKLFSQVYFPENLANRLYTNYTNELKFKVTVSADHTAWEKSQYGASKSSEPTYKAPEYKYSKGG